MVKPCSPNYLGFGNTNQSDTPQHIIHYSQICFWRQEDCQKWTWIYLSWSNHCYKKRLCQQSSIRFTFPSVWNGKAINLLHQGNEETRGNNFIIKSDQTYEKDNFSGTLRVLSQGVEYDSNTKKNNDAKTDFTELSSHFPNLVFNYQKKSLLQFKMCHRSYTWGACSPSKHFV